MATRNFPSYLDTFVIQVAPTDANGSSVALPVGLINTGGGNALMRSLIAFSTNWTGVSSITSAVLWLRTNSSAWEGGSPGQIIKRVTSSWSEAANWNTQPSTTATDQVTAAMGGAFSTWYAVDITNLVKAWAPTSIPGGGGLADYGIMLLGNGEASTADSATFSSRESAYDPYIVLTYGSNVAPNAPTLNSPVGLSIVASQTPTLNFTPNDADGDTHTEYWYQVDDNDDFLSLDENAVIAGTFANGTPVNRAVVATLTRGGTYAWRVKTKDATLYGPYATGYFKIGQLPTTVVTVPAAGHTAPLWYTAGTSTTPKIRVGWSFSCADGHAQTHYKVKLYADSGGSPGSNVYDSGWIAGAALYHDTTYTCTNGTKYHASVQVRCSLTLESAESTKNITRVRWARASYFFDSGSTPVTLNVDHVQSVTANQELVLEYTATGSSAEPSTWYQNVASAGLQRYFWHRVTMWGFGSATPTSPSLFSLTWSYSANGLVLDNWQTSSGTVDTSQKVYGTQSLRHNTDGTTQQTLQYVTVEPNRNMILSGRMKISGNPNAAMFVLSSDALTEITSVSAPGVTTDWARYSTPSFNTGSETTVLVVLAVFTAAGSTAWFDAIKLEESTVATPWTPGFVGGAVTIDSGGIGVNANKGGVLRLLGSAGGVGDTVTLGAHGLVLGTVGFTSGSVFPTSPTTGEVCFRTDYGIDFYYDGTQWCSAQVFNEAFIRAIGDESITATPPAQFSRVSAAYGGAALFSYRVDQIIINFYVAGGTALSGSHKWVGTYVSSPAATALLTATINSGALDTFRSTFNTVGVVLPNTTVTLAESTWTKTGTPGTLYLWERISYRLIVT